MNSRLKPVRINYNNYSQDTMGADLSDVFKSMFNSAVKKMASESSKKIIKSAAETAAKAAVEPVAKIAGEVVANKIFKSATEIPVDEEERPIKYDKGSIIEKEIKKIYKSNDNKCDNRDYIKNKFNELL